MGGAAVAGRIRCGSRSRSRSGSHLVLHHRSYQNRSKPKASLRENWQSVPASGAALAFACSQRGCVLSRRARLALAFTRDRTPLAGSWWAIVGPINLRWRFRLRDFARFRLIKCPDGPAIQSFWRPKAWAHAVSLRSSRSTASKVGRPLARPWSSTALGAGRYWPCRRNLGRAVDLLSPPSLLSLQRNPACRSGAELQSPLWPKTTFGPS